MENGIRVLIRFCDFTIHHSRFTIESMSVPLNLHAARTALNQDPKLRQWAEAWLKDKERTITQTMTDEEFEKHWLYVRPERMHEGAIAAVAAYRQGDKED